MGFITSASPAPYVKTKLPCCKSTKSENGFYHPGIYHDCKSLQRIQDNYQSGKWAYVHALDLVIDRAASLQLNQSWEMAGPFEEVNWAGGDGHNIPLQEDGKAAYMLTLGWYATGNKEWLSRAYHIIHEWSTTLRILNEHIQGGEGLAYMTASAEILRATSPDSGWTDEDTENMNAMITSIIEPWTELEGLTRINFWMNQGWYGNNGAMTVAVFSENRTLYEKMVHQATVGSHPIPSLDYAIPLQILDDPDYLGQVVEMGRDQFHPMGTLRGLAFSGHTSAIQRGVDYFSLAGNRMLHGWEYWARYNNSSDVAWKPLFVGAGGESWPVIASNGRGRNYEQYWQPVEAIGVGYYEYFRRGKACYMPWLIEYMSWQGVGWSTFEWGSDAAVARLGYSLDIVEQ
ncbi:chondroitin AC/alginate lyase [Sarocladium strictum]